MSLRDFADNDCGGNARCALMVRMDMRFRSAEDQSPNIALLFEAMRLNGWAGMNFIEGPSEMAVRSSYLIHPLAAAPLA